VVALQELAPLVNVLPPPLVCVQQLPHRERGVYLQALLALLRSAKDKRRQVAHQQSTTDQPQQ
jgi:hypothetical protein